MFIKNIFKSLCFFSIFSGAMIASDNSESGLPYIRYTICGGMFGVAHGLVCHDYVYGYVLNQGVWVKQLVSRQLLKMPIRQLPMSRSMIVYGVVGWIIDRERADFYAALKNRK